MRAAYTGHEALTFGDYLDLDTGKTLLAEPGGVYDIAPASGRNVDEIPAPWFIAAEPLADAWPVPKAIPVSAADGEEPAVSAPEEGNV